MQMKRLVLASALGVGAIGALLLGGQSGAVTEPSVLDPLFAADQGDARAALIHIAGQAPIKRYGAGYSDKTRFISWSMAKSVTAVLIGELVADGLCRMAKTR
jgi:CubicO group peptidase (beta-lactamase class C family)